jgi:hypothetical protein
VKKKEKLQKNEEQIEKGHRQGKEGILCDHMQQNCGISQKGRYVVTYMKTFGLVYAVTYPGRGSTPQLEILKF